MGVPLALLLPLLFLWEVEGPRAATHNFVMVLEVLDPLMGTQRYVVAGSAPNACMQLPSAVPESFCTALACPGAGRFRVRVTLGQEESEPVEFRTADSQCQHIEVIEGGIGHGGRGARLPNAVPCRPVGEPVTPPPHVPPVEIPAPGIVRVDVKVPTETAPVFTPNPQVIAKVPHAPGSVPLPAPRESKIATLHPSAPEGRVHDGRPTRITPEMPPPPPPMRPCP